MIDKSIYIVMFMYALSFSFLTVQFIAADLMGFTMTNFDGVPMESELLGITNITNLNTASKNVATANYTVIDVAAAFFAAGNVVKELLLLLTGTYIFNILVFFGVPAIFVAGMMGLYIFFLARTIIALIRGI